MVYASLPHFTVCGQLPFSFFFNDTATPEIYPLSLHDALPISVPAAGGSNASMLSRSPTYGRATRSEEHTSEPQSPCNLVCRLLLEKMNDFVQVLSSLCHFIVSSLPIHRSYGA